MCSQVEAGMAADVSHSLNARVAFKMLHLFIVVGVAHSFW